MSKMMSVSIFSVANASQDLLEMDTTVQTSMNAWM
jgi:hypothetical protein